MAGSGNDKRLSALHSKKNLNEEKQVPKNALCR
jgi:hypothetical protein